MSPRRWLVAVMSTVMCTWFTVDVGLHGVDALPVFQIVVDKVKKIDPGQAIDAMPDWVDERVVPTTTKDKSLKTKSDDDDDAAATPPAVVRMQVSDFAAAGDTRKDTGSVVVIVVVVVALVAILTVVGTFLYFHFHKKNLAEKGKKTHNMRGSRAKGVGRQHTNSHAATSGNSSWNKLSNAPVGPPPHHHHHKTRYQALPSDQTNGSKRRQSNEIHVDKGVIRQHHNNSAHHANNSQLQQ